MYRRTTLPFLAALTALMLVIAACGGDEEKTATPAPGGPTGTAQPNGSPQVTASPGMTMPPGPSTPIASLTTEPDAETAEPTDVVTGEGGSCRFTITGDVTGEYEGPGGASAVGTDYWMTEDEMREALKFLTNLDSSLSDAEKEQKLDEAMQADPRIFLLLLNCQGEGASISLFPSGQSKYADVPFGPGSYVIAAGGLLGGAEEPGEFGVLLSVGDGSYSLPEDGAIEITKFDETGIAGNFSFDAEEAFAEGTPKEISVEGEFDFDCTGGSVCQ